MLFANIWPVDMGARYTVPVFTGRVDGPYVFTCSVLVWTDGVNTAVHGM